MNNKLTKAEWDQVEDSLKSFYSPVGLICDGFHVMLILGRHSAFKNKIDVYVNGVMSFDYKPETEEILRFSFPSVRFVHSTKERASLRKEPKWLLKKLGKGFQPDETYTIYTPCWGSFKALKANLIKLNGSI